MKHCAVCGCYVPDGQSVCPACGAEYKNITKDIVEVKSCDDCEVCHRANGTFFVRAKEAPKRRRKTSPGQA